MKPKYKIIADDNDITELIHSRLISLSISDEIGLVSDTMTMELDDRDSAFALPSSGAVLSVAMGYDELYPMGQFVADEIELNASPQTLTITARASNSNLHDMGEFKAPKTESWDKKTLTSIVQTIAGRYGITAAISATFAGIQIDHVDQTEESDCAFIQRLAGDYGAAIKIAGGKLMFIDPLTGKFPDGSPLPTIPVTTVSSMRLRITERNKYGKVSAKYYDVNKAEEQEITVGTSPPTYQLRDTYSNQQQAQLQAQAKLNEIADGTYALTVDMPGNPMLGAESVIDIQVGRPEFRGKWVIKSCRHTMNSSGYKTSIEATRPREATDG